MDVFRCSFSYALLVQRLYPLVSSVQPDAYCMVSSLRRRAHRPPILLRRRAAPHPLRPPPCCLPTLPPPPCIPHQVQSASPASTAMPPRRGRPTHRDCLHRAGEPRPPPPTRQASTTDAPTSRQGGRDSCDATAVDKLPVLPPHSEVHAPPSTSAPACLHSSKQSLYCKSIFQVF